MRSLIVYYSYSGNTQKVAEVLKERLSKKGIADIFRIEPQDESDKFLKQAMRAFIKKKAIIGTAPYDVAGYDLICIGSPVWAFAPAPSINTYIDGIKNTQGKDALCFVTYGSGLGAGRCLDMMEAAFKEKGAFKTYELKVQQLNAHDEGFLRQAVDELINLI